MAFGLRPLMRLVVHLVLTVGSAIAATTAIACDRPVCIVPPGSLPLLSEITFDDQPSGFGPGRQIDGVLDLPGARFGEMFDGQILTSQAAFDAPYDVVFGPANAALALLPGPPGHNLSILRLPGTNVLSGDGPSGVPRQDATGEGAIAVEFADRQGAVRLTLRGGEGGAVTVLFLAVNGSIIDVHAIAPVGEGPVDFLRRDGLEDIAGLVVSNRDPEGIALDAIAFGAGRQVSMLR